MIKKGLTPVVAIVLLLTITVASVGVVYTIFQSSQETATDNTNIGFSEDNLNVEACRNKDTNAILTVRNSGETQINLSRISVKINGDLRTKTADPKALSSKETGTLELEDTYLKSITTGKLISGSVEKTFTCNARQEGPPSPSEDSIPTPSP